MCSSFWRQMLADVFAVPVVTTNAVEGGAFGAAMLAATGAGIFSSVREASDGLIRRVGVTEPQNSSDYQPFYEIYRELYPVLKATFLQQSRAEGELP